MPTLIKRRVRNSKFQKCAKIRQPGNQTQKKCLYAQETKKNAEKVVAKSRQPKRQPGNQLAQVRINDKIKKIPTRQRRTIKARNNSRGR